MADITQTETTQIEFLFESDGDSLGWIVRQVHIVERLNEPYRMLIELDNPNPDVDATELFGKNATIFILRAPLFRQIRGLIVRVEKGMSTDPRYSVCVLHVQPAFSMLRQRVNSRIFQFKSVPDILEKVIGERLADYERELDPSGLQASYKVREYTVQYQESDFDFVSRLMEQEGIAYRFTHAGEVETMALSDDNKSFDTLESTDGNVVNFVQDNISSNVLEPVSAFKLGKELSPTSVVMRDFDWTNPALAPQKTISEEDVTGREREIYEYQRGMTVTGYEEPQYKAHDFANQAQLRLEEHRIGAIMGRGESAVTGLAAGMIFELVNHADFTLNGEYAVVSVEHRAVRFDKGGGTGQGYSNRFTCMPADVLFRPPRRTPRPRVHGIQTAIVTGPSGEEIHTDVHGRIKVQFHWDRLGARDDHSSCWIRVMQPWGGSGWGFVFIPRMGMEVVVTFVDGDPDRPLVTGSVYNGDNPPPYTLPDEKTKSTLQTRSSLQSDGFNELRFEDMADEEEIYIRAQKDFNEHVLNDHSTQVDHDQTNTVDNDQTEHVKHDQTLTVDNDRTKTVKNDETSTIENNRTETVKKDETITIEGNREETVNKNEELTVKKDQTITIDGKRTETVKKDDKVTIKGKATYTIEKNHTTKVNKGKVVKVKSGYALTVDKGILAKAKKKIVLKAGDSSITLKSDGTIEIKGKTIKITGGKSKAELSDSETKFEAPKVDIKGDDGVKLDGAKVELK